MLTFCGVDFETRSGADLPKVGSRNYAAHHTTDVICCSYLRDKKVYSWWPEWVADRIKENPPHPPPWQHRPAGEIYTAWNSAFDRQIWNHVCVKKYGWPLTVIEDWLCSMTVGLVNGLPKPLAFVTGNLSRGRYYSLNGIRGIA